MPASAEQLKLARSWIGEAETDDVFNERFDRLEEDLDAAISESLRAQIGVLESDQPASIGLPSGLNVGYEANIRNLKATLDDFLATGGTSGSFTQGTMQVLRLVRPDYR